MCMVTMSIARQILDVIKDINIHANINCSILFNGLRRIDNDEALGIKEHYRKIIRFNK